MSAVRPAFGHVEGRMHHAERRTRLVAGITAATMVVEIAAGWWFNSMSLLADGWHMGTHAAAIGLSAVAYALARRWHDDPRFAFGPWKVEVLAAFASAIALLAAAVSIAAASFERLLNAQPIRYEEAIAVAAVGLVVNLVCAWLLGPHEHGDAVSHGIVHSHDHEHGAPRGSEDSRRAAVEAGPLPAAHHHGDLNLRAAYLHVVADAATSALAIAALAAGLWLGWRILDPLVGLIGAAMVARWGWQLVRETAGVLLDREMGEPFVAQVRHALAHDAPWSGRTDVHELRLWRTAAGQWSGVLRLRTSDPGLNAAQVRRLLARWPQLARTTIEIEVR